VQEIRPPKEGYMFLVLLKQLLSRPPDCVHVEDIAVPGAGSINAAIAIAVRVRFPQWLRANRLQVFDRLIELPVTRE
jgi:hypothetical protein